MLTKIIFLRDSCCAFEHWVFNHGVYIPDAVVEIRSYICQQKQNVKRRFKVR